MQRILGELISTQWGEGQKNNIPKMRLENKAVAAESNGSKIFTEQRHTRVKEGSRK